MKKVMVVALAFYLLLLVGSASAWIHNSSPDGMQFYIFVDTETSIDIWIGNFRRPTGMMRLTIDEHLVRRFSTFDYVDGEITNWQDRTIMFGTLAQTRDYYIEYVGRELRIQNNWEGLQYSMRWAGCWGHFAGPVDYGCTMASYFFSYVDGYNRTGYYQYDGQPQIPINFTGDVPENPECPSWVGGCLP